MACFLGARVSTSTSDFFRSHLDPMVDPRHPLAVLARRLDWAQIESRIAPLFARDGLRHAAEGADLFGPTPTTVAVHAGGRPRLPFRLMVSLLYLKHAYGESDEPVCARWSENVVWQLSSGMDYYTPKLPCDPIRIGRFRRVLGEAGVEELLSQTITTAVKLEAVEREALETVVVDTTVQEKAVAYPIDSRLLEAVPRTAYTDLGFRGVGGEIGEVSLIHRGKLKTLTKAQRTALKRRQAVEPVTGHMKQDHGMGRCWLKGVQGDALNAVLSAAGYNLRWLLWVIAESRAKPAFLCLMQAWLACRSN